MRIVVYYRKNLKMSPGKMASQVGHVCKELGKTMTSEAKEDTIIVLGVRDNKYSQLKQMTCYADFPLYEQVDLGYTELTANTPTCFGYIDGGYDYES